jgi:tripartite-type tricarboxylate transporter receptor subunit TctC
MTGSLRLSTSRRGLIAAGAATVLPLPAIAQAFPSRQLRIIVPYAPGGQGDITARLLAEHLAPRLGQTVIVENRPGANGTIGTNVVARATPDGYTIGVVVASHVLQRALLPNVPYDPTADFTPITMVARTQMVLVSSPAIPPTTLAEFIAYARARPGELAYKSAGAGSNSHLFGAWLADAAGLDMIHAPFRGSGDSAAPLMNGTVHLGFDTLPAVLGHIQAGRLRLLAAGGPDRSPQFPAIPTVAEAGIANFAANSWSMVLAPRALPAPIAERLGRECAEILRMSAVVERLTQMGAVPVASSPAEARRILESEEQLYTDLIRRLGIRLG